MSLAVAASVLIGLIVIALPSGPTVTSEQIALPLAEFEMITGEQLESQSRMLKSLELELRALKLEVNSLGTDSVSGSTPGDKQRVEEILDQLIEKVNQLSESDSN